MTIIEATAAYLAFKRDVRGVAGSSIYTYGAHLKRWRQAVGAQREVDDAAELCEQFLLALGRRGRSDNYRSKAFKVLRDFFRWACDHGHARLNPLRDVRAPIVHEPQVRFLNPPEVERLLAAARAGGDWYARRDHALLATLYGTWARVSEICRSRPEDYDLTTETVRLYGKGGKFRTIPFDPSLTPILRAWQAQRPAVSPMMFPAHSFNGAAFGVLERDRVARVLRRVYAPAAGLGSGVTPHALRRSGADAARRRGVKLEIIQRILGHASITTTMRYLAVPSPDELRGAWRKDTD